MSSSSATADVVIVGAGLAGLVTARCIAAEGLRVAVLEAADHVGGRTRSVEAAGATVDLGGTFVGPTQDRVLRLAAELGCTTEPTYTRGESILRWRGRLRRYRGTIPKMNPATLADVERIRVMLDRAAHGIDPARQAITDRRDHKSLDAWLRDVHAGRGAHDLMAIVSKVTWGCEPAEISLLHVLRYVKGCGGVQRILDTEGGAQQEHFVAGAQSLSEQMARDLGDAVHLSSPVTSISHADEGAVTVRHGDRAVATAALVVVAVPPAMRTRITFDPALPSTYAGLSQRWPQGALSKAYAVYRAPFWRDAGLNGQALADEGPVFITFDASPRDAQGVLLGFIGGDYARRFDLLPPAERRLQALQSFASLFGPEALTPLGFVDQRWSEEPWIGGGPTAVPGPGAINGYGDALSRPLGRIHWAGTETADRWAGFMDGAVRSGERAAAEVLAALATELPTTKRIAG